MIYAEASFFEGNHCAHVALWEDRQRVERIRKNVRNTLERRKGSRAYRG